MEKETEHDIWEKGIKTIVGHHKKALLDYVDAIEASTKDFGAVKAKIHNNLSQVQFTLGMLFQTYRAGGTIKPFEDGLRSQKPERKFSPGRGSHPHHSYKGKTPYKNDKSQAPGAIPAGTK